MSKIIIEIPDNVNYKYYDMPYFILDAIARGKHIPDNATNGDMVKVMFPKAIDKKVKPTNKVHFMDDFKGELYGIGVISLEWWNAPYKAGSEE